MENFKEEKQEKFTKRVHGKENNFIQVEKKEINKPTLNISFADLLKNKSKLFDNK